MSERRPHWSDDLIESVQRILDREWSRPEGPHEKAFDIIATVEDWHERKGEENLPLLMAMMNAESTGFLRRAEQAEAAIARVRDVCDRIWDDARYAHKYGFLEVVREVRYALEGDSDE